MNNVEKAFLQVMVSFYVRCPRHLGGKYVRARTSMKGEIFEGNMGLYDLFGHSL